MAALNLFPARVQFTDKDGYLTPEAFRALHAVFERIGGASAPSNSELAISDDDDSGLEELKAESFKAFDALGMVPVFQPESTEQLMTELADLREQVAILATRINDLMQGTTP